MNILAAIGIFAATLAVMTWLTAVALNQSKCQYFAVIWLSSWAVAVLGGLLGAAMW